MNRTNLYFLVLVWAFIPKLIFLSKVTLILKEWKVGTYPDISSSILKDFYHLWGSGMLNIIQRAMIFKLLRALKNSFIFLTLIISHSNCGYAKFDVWECHVTCNLFMQSKLHCTFTLYLWECHLTCNYFDEIPTELFFFAFTNNPISTENKKEPYANIKSLLVWPQFRGQ